MNKTGKNWFLLVSKLNYVRGGGHVDVCGGQVCRGGRVRVRAEGQVGGHDLGEPGEAAGGRGGGGQPLGDLLLCAERVVSL